MVRVARNVSGARICDLARNLAEGVPNRGSTAILCCSAFNLVSNRQKWLIAVPPDGPIWRVRVVIQKLTLPSQIPT
jgi:hypothetical protein